MLNAINAANVTRDIRTFFDEVYLQKLFRKLQCLWSFVSILFKIRNFCLRYEIEISQDTRPFSNVCG